MRSMSQLLFSAQKLSIANKICAFKQNNEAVLISGKLVSNAKILFYVNFLFAKFISGMKNKDKKVVRNGISNEFRY